MEQQDFNPSTNQDSSLFQMNLDAQNSYNLRSAASWAKVLGVVGVITGIFLLIIIGNQLGKLDNYRYGRTGFGGTLGATKASLWMMIIGAIMASIGGVFSFNFGNKINAALKANNQDGLNAGFAALRNFFAIRSVLLIIIMLLLLLSMAALF